MSLRLEVNPKHRPELDPQFVPASLWNRAYHELVGRVPQARPLALALSRPDGRTSVYQTRLLPHEERFAALNRVYAERLLKFLLWQRGGSRVIVGGEAAVAQMLRGIYRPGGERAFDHEFMGEKVYAEPFTIEACPLDEVPAANDGSVVIGRNLDGCRIGFDLGGSDRKCAALIDGEVVFSEEVTWDPYFQQDPSYHFDGIHDTLRRAAEKLPRVDAIGGSAAGVYVNNEVRVASLFRGVPPEAFEKRIRRIFFDLQEKWGGVPFEVMNDGDVTALAGSMALKDSPVLGISMGTSQAAGYVEPSGHLTSWLNELAFAPIDYRERDPVIDEWSGDAGCGAKFFSQQAVARLLPAAGIDLPEELPAAEKLARVQELMAQGDGRAGRIFATIGTFFGYALAHYADFYELRHVLFLGRVTSGEGGSIIMEQAKQVLRDEFPELSEKIRLSVPDEHQKRHGQAVAAASLPAIPRC